MYVAVNRPNENRAYAHYVSKVAAQTRVPPQNGCVSGAGGASVCSPYKETVRAPK